MNDDALAAVVAAAQRLVALARVERGAPAAPRWAVAARIGTDGVARVRLVAASGSRWRLSERFRD